MKTVISLADITGNMAQPWVDAGYEAFLVDPQHGTTRKEGPVTKFAGTIEEAMPAIGELIRSGNVAMVFGFRTMAPRIVGLHWRTLGNQPSLRTCRNLTTGSTKPPLVQSAPTSAA